MSLHEIFSIELDALADLIAGRYELASASAEEAARRMAATGGGEAAPGGKNGSGSFSNTREVARGLISLMQDQIRSQDFSDLSHHPPMLRAMCRALEEYAGAPLEMVRSDAGAENRESIFEALEEMLFTPADFVQVEVPGTAHFIQFANPDGRILLDLPVEALEGDEIVRARRYFTRIGAEVRPYGMDGESYQKDFRLDSMQAARAAEEIMAEVYLVGDDPDIIVRIQ